MASTSAPSETSTDGIEIAAEVLDAAQALIGNGRRALLGLVGAPASGKSTLAETLTARLGADVPGGTQAVPMDGFHLSQRELERLGRVERKGAPDTFDAAGYRHLLARIRAGFDGDETIYAPGFYRALEEPIAASVAVMPATSLVITEGNYLLLGDDPWPLVARELDTIWYLHVDTGLRETWLAERHQRFGRSAAEAQAWIAATDRPNADRIEATAARADRHLLWDGSRIRFVKDDETVPV